MTRSLCGRANNLTNDRISDTIPRDRPTNMERAKMKHRPPPPRILAGGFRLFSFQRKTIYCYGHFNELWLLLPAI